MNRVPESKEEEEAQWNFAGGYYRAVAILLRKQGHVDDVIRSFFVQGEDGENPKFATLEDQALFRQHGLIEPAATKNQQILAQMNDETARRESAMTPFQREFSRLLGAVECHWTKLSEADKALHRRLCGLNLVGSADDVMALAACANRYGISVMVD